MSSEIKHLNDEIFDAEISEGFTLVDFYADWCGPCRMMVPVLEEFAKEKKGEISVGKLDIESAQETTKNFNINSVPTLILFHKGREIERIVGVKDLASLNSIVGQAVSKA